jgi:hypothetical protein
VVDLLDPSLEFRNLRLKFFAKKIWLTQFRMSRFCFLGQNVEINHFTGAPQFPQKKYSG